MACRVVNHGRVVFVLWGDPEMADMDRILQAVSERHRAFGPIVFIARVPPSAAPPSEPIRREIARKLPQVFERCVSYHALLEGEGFVAATKRAAIATIFLMSGGRKRYYVHATHADILRAAPTDYVADVELALKSFESRGLLSNDLAALPPDAFVSQ
jgi:hypothetical protein